MQSSHQQSEVHPAKEDVTLEHHELGDDPKKNVQQPDKFGSYERVDPKEIALVRKLDMYMMPTLWLMYFLNFLDRNTIVNGKLNNLDKELNLVGSQYNTCVSIFFVGLILGLSEAPFYPGAIYLVSIFYTRKETAARLAIFYTGNMLASTFSGLIAAGVFAGLDGKHGLSGWRWLFLIQGVATVAVAVAAFFLLPNTPLQTRWLTEEERQLAHHRVARDTTDKRYAPSSTWAGLWDAAKDYRTWVFALMANLHLSANGFKNYMPTAVESLGFSTTITLVLTCPPYLLASITSVLVSWSSGRFNERTWHITISKALAIVGFAVATSTYNIGARYFAMVLFVGATYGVNNINLSWVSATVGQTDEKKAAALAIVNSLGNLSFVYTPYLWTADSAPLFRPAMLASVGFSIGVIVVAWAMKWILIRINRKIRVADTEAINFYAY
ncbi:hypothetical protein DL765_000114 [Monosporascus sp. GIB2]|nr:hypothetical protein DL765_000114 [Monosporascus sp. GIB2]